MTQPQLITLLESITGHINAATPEQKKILLQAQKRIAGSLLQTDDTGSEQLFENSDFYAREKINPEQLQNIADIAKQAVQQNVTGDVRVFVRTVPVRNPNVAGSVPDWAIGAKAFETIGPLISSDGREIWVDVFRIVKLVTLYIGNQPVLLFKASIPIISVQPATSYTIVSGSVYVHARLFAASAPVDKFVGIKVKSGSLKLSVAPTMQAGKLTLAANCNIELNVQTEQDVDAGAAETSKFGKDARDARFQLPVSFKFNYNGTTKRIASMAIPNATSDLLGQAMTLTYSAVPDPPLAYNDLLNLLVVPMNSSIAEFKISKSQSTFVELSGTAPIIKAYWALYTTSLDINNVLEAEGNGGILLQCGKGFRATWQGLLDEDSRLIQPFIFAAPGTLSIVDMVADTSGAAQHFDLWKNEQKEFRSSVDMLFLNKAPLGISFSSSKSQEFITSLCNADFKTDRPVKVNGEAFTINSRLSMLMLGASDARRLLYIYDDNIIADNTQKVAGQAAIKPVAIALENAVFTVSPVNTCLLFGECDINWVQVNRANFFVSFVLFRYLPTLPDPYVGNLRAWDRIFGRTTNSNTAVNRQATNNPVSMLIASVKWNALSADKDNINTGFHFGMLPAGALTDLQGGTTPGPGPVNRGGPLTLNSLRSVTALKNASRITLASIDKTKLENKNFFEKLLLRPGISDTIAAESPIITTNATGQQLTQSLLESGKSHRYEDLWDNTLFGNRINTDAFALLDVSSNANQLGVSVNAQMIIVKTGSVVGEGNIRSVASTNTGFPFIVEGMEVKAPGTLVKSFTLPQFAWEPVINLTPPDRDNPLDLSSPKLAMDPEAGPIYFEDDGGPTRIWNNSTKPVSLAPIPVVKSLIDEFKNNPQNFTVAAGTLPFGLKAISFLSKNFVEPKKPDIKNIRPLFRKQADGSFKLQGGIQLSLTSGDFGKHFPDPLDNDKPMFPGYILQLNNLLNIVGTKTVASNLGHRVTEIFNNEFLIGVLSLSNKLKDSRGVPVKRIDLTGYGANMFSEWVSPSAAMAQTSQAKFDVMMGRTAHEVIQVKSILYPWGIRVVRTITIFRLSTGYVYRTDSGWKAESDGKFDFSYRYMKKGVDPYKPDLKDTDFIIENAPYEFHPGVISGLFNVRNIKDAPSVKEYDSTNDIPNNTDYVNGIKGQVYTNTSGSTLHEPVKCGGVYFDADVEIENVVQGHISRRVVSKKILGYVQVAPAGKPLTADQLKELLAIQNNSIGGDLDCVIDINKSDQQMRLNRFDVNASIDGSGKPVFVIAARGNVFLPKDGSWAMVQHNAGSGEVTQLPEGVTVPLIRTGKWKKEVVIDPAVVSGQLLRIAHPLEILRAPGNSTINFGYLQSTATQKCLFLTPAYRTTVKMLMSKTPPIFADAYRMMTGNSIFPNVGNAIDNFGKAMPILNGIDSAANATKAFVTNALSDGGTKVLELMQIQAEKAGEAVIRQGMSLLQKGLNGAVDKALKFDVPPFDIPLVDIKGLKIFIEYKAGKGKDAPKDSKLNYDVDSFTGDLAKQWKSRLNNLAMVIDLGDMKSIMTIKGNFDANKSKETGYEGGDDSGINGLPVPELQFSDALEPVIEILEVSCPIEFRQLRSSNEERPEDSHEQFR